MQKKVKISFLGGPTTPTYSISPETRGGLFQTSMGPGDF